MLHHMLRAAAQRAFSTLDPYFKYVTMLLHGDGSALGSDTVTPFNSDASTNAFNVTINGDARSNNFNPYQAGYYSNYFDGSGDYLTAGSSISLSGDFTVEGWCYPTSSSGNGYYMFGLGNDYFSTGATFFITTSGYLRIYTGNANILSATSGVVQLNTWNHIAFVRSGTTVKAYLNGVQVDSATLSSTISGTAYINAELNGNPTATVYVGSAGYYSNVRIGTTAVYTTAFTPSTTPLTAITGTQLLTCQSNRFIDNSTNAYTITKNGDTAVAPAQPFTLPSSVATYGSGYFDGTGDYLTTPSTGQFAPSSDFTISCWYYPTSTRAYQQIIGNFNGSASTVWIFEITSGTGINFYTNGITPRISGSGLVINAWNYLVLARSGSTITGYVNGVSLGTYSQSGTFGSSTQPISIGRGGSSSAAGDISLGYIADVKLIDGSAVTTIPTAPQTATTGTQLLTTQYNGGGNNNGFKDSSQNNFPITRNGNTTQGTFSPFGSNWSNYFSSNSGLTAPNNSAFKPATNSFTVECWIFQTSSGTTQVIYGDTNSSTDEGTFDLFISSSGFLSGDYWTGPVSIVTRTSTLSPIVNQWNHVVVSRTGTTMYLGLNGVLQSFTAPSSYQSPATTYPTVGRLGAYASGAGFIGYISNFRYINGTNLYSGSTYTVPTAPLTAVTNTSLLTCADNRFIDDSTNNFTLTKNNSVSVQRFSPFSPTTAYSTSVIGGSGYFDGTGDYLNTSSTQVVPTGSFTVECWVYVTSTSNQGFVAQGTSGNSARFSIAIDGGLWWTQIGNTNINVGTPITNAWNYLATTFNGSTLTLYVNGTSVGTASTTTSAQNTTLAIGTLGSGWATTGYFVNGYVSNVRISNTVRTITIPTAPYTSDANTTFLGSFTNAGILDNAMMNDLETVGNAQISTSVKKYGTGSMYFDGTGDYLQTVDSPNVELGGGNFTLEAWIYPTSLTTGNFILSKQTNVSTASAYAFRVLDSTSGGNASKLAFYASSNGSTWDIVAITATTALSINTWYHVAVTRSSSSFTIWLNGVSDGTGTSSTAIQDTTNPLCIGAAPGGGGTYTGYIDDLRITKGVARYTTTFTPPTAAFPNN